MPFKSRQPDIDVPSNVTNWTWLFDSPVSPLQNNDTSSLSGYTDALNPTQRLNWAQVKQHTTHLSTALVKHFGLQKGDTVALFSPNNIWYPVAMLAVSRVAGVVSGASPAYNVEEMTYALEKGKAKFLFTSRDSLAVAREAAEKAGVKRERVFLLEGREQGFKSMAELLEIGKIEGEKGQVEAYRLKEREKNGDLCAFLSFSSGTTGLPKAVMISHQNVIAQCLQIQQITPSSHRKILAVLPAFHITGLVHALHLPILINAEVYMLSSFTMPSMLSTVVKYQIGELLIVPPILIRLVRDPIVKDYDLGCVKRFSSGAAPLSEEILHMLQERFPGSGFKQGYGMTESCSCITSHPPGKYDFQYAHSVGMVVASTTIKIIDEEGKECGINTPGELLARGPQITMGYLGNEEATRNTYDGEGYLHTGDQAVIDEDGMVTITDRIKEMIKVKGIGVAPAELEDLLLGHEVVEDVAVLGIKDEYSGERPKAYVVLKKGYERKEQEMGKRLLKYVREKKVRYKWVKEVEFIGEIPKSASGKILRRFLRDKSRQGSQGVVVNDEGEKAKL